MSERRVLAQAALARLQAAAQAYGQPAAFMEVCGTHTVAAFRAGLHSLLPPNVRLISGPGCPVCVTAQGDIDQMLTLAMDHDVVLCTYGDMIRVPGHRGSLETARAAGRAVRVVFSALDAVRLARRLPDRQVVLAAVGFETTAPATAAAVKAAVQQRLTNFSVLVSHKRVLPAMLALVASPAIRVNGFLCPGHVSVILGAQVYRPLVDTYRLPCVIAGFEDFQIVAALADLMEQTCEHRAALVNAYPQAVSDAGNRVAQRLLDDVFEPATVRWRGLGTIPDSGLVLRPAFHALDAARRFELVASTEPEPAGCICGAVITGAATPDACGLFARSCTPVNPVGPCMVSSEGTCQAWFKYRRARLIAKEPA